jgi:hypothetical protein
VVVSPQRMLVPSPQRMLVPSPQRIFLPSPGYSQSGRKRERSVSSSSSDFSYSSSEEDSSDRETKKIRCDYIDSKGPLGKPPSPPKYYPEQPDEEDIDSSDSEYEDDESVDSASIEDLREFIDFDPRYNRTQISKRKFSQERGDELDDFLFSQPAKPRKWFKAFAWNAVGPKLSRQPTPTR